MCWSQAGGTVRRQRFLPVRVWLVVGFGISPSYVDKRWGAVVFLCGEEWLGGWGVTPLMNNPQYTPYIFPHTKKALYSTKTGLSFTYLEVVS